MKLYVGHYKLIKGRLNPSIYRGSGWVFNKASFFPQKCLVLHTTPLYIKSPPPQEFVGPSVFAERGGKN